jgi:hypothetical protein
MGPSVFPERVRKSMKLPSDHPAEIDFNSIASILSFFLVVGIEF